MTSPSVLLDREDTDPIVLPNGTYLNCLLYADDLLLISHSAEGLQKALSVLSEYCNKWLLLVNSKKTKVLLFQKKFRKLTLHKHCFQIKNDKIEIVNNYTYLGIIFSTMATSKNIKIKSKEIKGSCEPTRKCEMLTRNAIWR